MWLCQTAVVLLFIYSAYGQTSPKDGFCASNSECPMDRVCDQSKCVDPCQLNLCGDNADCKVTKHIPFCSVKAPLCILQHEKPGFCANNSECPMDRVCDQSKCVDPCQLNPCGDNYDCKVTNHIPFCSVKAPLCSLQPGCRNGPKKYIVYKEKLNWHGALLNCSLQGMSLATVENQQDQDNLVNAMKQTFPDNGIWWTMLLGGADLHQEGKFFWYSTGEPLKYNNFAPWEPTDVGHGEQPEDCIAMVAGDLFQYRWNDVSCDGVNEFACEYFE